MARNIEDFCWTPELGRRLRALRKRAGFTQAALAAEMGQQNPGRRMAIYRLERPGNSRWSPTLALLAAYLRACRASFADIADLLEAYTSRLPVRDAVVQQAVARAAGIGGPKVVEGALLYDLKSELQRKRAGKEREPDEKRILRGRKVAAALARRSTFRSRLMTELGQVDIGVPVTRVALKLLVDFGLKYWAGLNRCRFKDEADKQRELEAAISQYEPSENLSRPALVNAARICRDIFEDMDRQGWLDAVYSEVDLQNSADLARRLKSRAERGAGRSAFNAAMAELASGIWGEAKELCIGVPEDRLGRYEAVVRQVCAICYWAGPQNPERRSQLEHYLCDPRYEKLGRDPHLARRVAELAERLFDERKSALLKHPDKPTDD
jgi:transcriptional regulator with XRE-family HTH domain